MADNRFDNRVAVITGGGRGLGRAYALLLGSLGAKIIINDIGGSIRGDGTDPGPAEEVAAEIRASGSQAFTSTDSVTTPDGGRKIIQAALDHFGKIDIFIHSAGNVRLGALAEISDEDFKAVVDVHLMGGCNVARAALPRMIKGGYGRVVLAGSISGLYGNRNCVNYGVSKAGLIGLNNVIAIEGAEHGIKSNIILPGAVTRMAEGLDISQYPPMGPELVAPVVGYLAHESCEITGEMLVSVGGRVARAYVAETEGIYRPNWTIAEVAENLGAIRDMGKQWVLPPAPSGFGDHLTRSFNMAKAKA
jgi:NAD(P)-dependent dehydrogenase (short-subunit alcohol dehydrogenase family)